MKSLGSVETSHTGAKLTLIPKSRSSASFSAVSLVMRSKPPSRYSACGDWNFVPRRFGIDAEQTGEYVRTVVTQMVSDKTGMVLKHFPGYGNNADTHTGIAIDERPMDTFRQSDFLPFEAGIESGAQSVLVSHNVVNCMDADRPASLSAEVHRILREELGFDGIILTDDLIMDAIRDYTGGENAAVLAVQAGNDMLTSSDFVTQYNAVLAAVQDGTIPESQIHASAVRVIDWKMQLGLISYDA